MDSRSVTVLLGAFVQGTVYTGFMPVAPILNAYHNDIGPRYGQAQTTTSFDGGTVFVTRKELASQVLSNGDYYLNHETGYYKVKAGANSTDLHATYYTQLPYQKIYDASKLQ